MKIQKLLTAAAITLLLFGCVKAPRGEQISSAEENLQSSVSQSTECIEIPTRRDRDFTAVNTPAGVDIQMLSPSYWINRHKNPDKILMSAADIDNFNRKNPIVITDNDGNVLCVDTIPDTLDGETVKGLLNCAYEFGKKDTYRNGSKTTGEYQRQMKSLLNLSAVPDTVTVRYGYSTEYTLMKGYPTDDEFYEKGNFDFDKNIMSDLLPYCPVAVLHESRDGRWLYILYGNCAGWVRTSQIALCRTRADWESRKQVPQDFAVVTAKEIRTETDSGCAAVSDKRLPMGTVLPLDNTVKKIRGRTAYGCYTAKVPARDNDGYIYDEYFFLPVSSDVSTGYLDFTYRNTINQAFKYQGAVYGMGGANNSVDCSGLVRNVFRCFGLNMPRVAKLQSQVLCANTVDIGGKSDGEKARVFDTDGVTIIYMPGHIMMYLGNVGTEAYCISSIYGFGEDFAAAEKVACVAVTNMNRANKSDGNTLIKRSVTAVTFNS